MHDALLAGQVEYYRRRANEYDRTAYGDLAAARRRIGRLVAQWQPGGTVFELACGTGLWTEALAAVADSVTAVDAAPEALEIARARVPQAEVRFEVADVFGWPSTRSSDTRADVVFFAAWLSHVPAARLADFWASLRPLLAPNGRVLFVDEHVAERAKEVYPAGADEVVERRLQDGTSHRIVKNFVDPEVMTVTLRRFGWDCRITRDGADWVLGEARPA